MASIRAMKGRKKHSRKIHHSRRNKHGEGIVDMYHKYKDHPIARPFVKHAKNYAHQGIRYLSKRAHEMIGNGISHSRRSHSRHMSIGSGMRRHHSRKRLNGKGLFSDIGAVGGSRYGPVGSIVG